MSDMYDVKTRVPHGQVHVRREDNSLDVGTINNEPSKTDPQWAQDCDINHIMATYAKTGQVNHLNTRTGVYADFSEIRDLQYAVEVVKYADEAFMSLPADVRKRFANDPNQLLQFLQDPKNHAEGVELGFFEPDKNANAKPQQKLNNEQNDEQTLLKNAKAKNKPATKPKQTDSDDEVVE